MKAILTIVLTLTFGLSSFVTHADNNSKEYRLGAFAGAMKYCEDEFDNSDRYRWARLRAADEFKDMSSAEKISFSLGRDNAIRNGRYFGKKLDKKQCGSLLNLSEWKRFKQK